MGPLQGMKVIELAGIGAGPFCGMMLADMGAEVLCIDRPGGNPSAAQGHSVLFRSRRHVALDLKSAIGAQAVLRLCEGADALFEGFRPGVAERLGVGPGQCAARNPALVYGRLTGWGQTGPLAQAAGHDINYISLSGALHAIGPKDRKPVVPLNLVGDFAGGGMLLAFGMVCALLEARRTGHGQVVDTSMVEGSALLMAMASGFAASGYRGERGTSFIDGSTAAYDVYETKDGKYVSIGSLEPQFYALLVRAAGLPEDRFGNQAEVMACAERKAQMAAHFRRKTRDEWCALLEGSDACFAPVLSLAEAPHHPHNRARESYLDVGGIVQPAPAPKFSRSRPDKPAPCGNPGRDTDAVFADYGFSGAEIAALKHSGAIMQA